MNSTNCEDYNNCVQSELEYLQEPVDEQSLYANRFYDGQVAANRCYNTMNAIEGFHDANVVQDAKRYRDGSMLKKFICFLISLVAIILAVVFCCSMCKKKHHRHHNADGYYYTPEVIHLDIPTERIVTSTYNKY